MKWYWVALIVIAVLALGYLVWMNMPKKTAPAGNTGVTGYGNPPNDPVNPGTV